jgi:hypothetical protein
MSKYELNSEVFKIAQRKDEIGILAQFCLQIERESIAADDYVVKTLDELSKKLDIELESLIKLKEEEDKRNQNIEDDE